MGNPAAPVVQYREEYIASFEQNYSLLKVGCTRETVIKGNQAVFLVAVLVPVIAGEGVDLLAADLALRIAKAILFLGLEDA